MIFHCSIQSKWKLMFLKLYVSAEVLVLLFLHKQAHTNRREFLFFVAEPQFPVPLCAVLICRSMFYLPPQPKSPVSSTKIPVQPPPQSLACEQQQAGMHPWRDRQGQGVDGTGEQCVGISACDPTWLMLTVRVNLLSKTFPLFSPFPWIMSAFRMWAAMRSRSCQLRWGGSKPYVNSISGRTVSTCCLRVSHVLCLYLTLHV